VLIARELRRVELLSEGSLTYRGKDSIRISEYLARILGIAVDVLDRNH